MPDNIEPCYSHEVFVPREIIFELCTEPDHLKFWWTDGTYTLKQTTEPSRVVFALPSTLGGAPADHEVTLELHDLKATTRIEVYQSHLADADAREQAATEWRLRLAALETYLSSI
jgi:hypothetical protein